MKSKSKRNIMREITRENLKMMSALTKALSENRKMREEMIEDMSTHSDPTKPGMSKKIFHSFLATITLLGGVSGTHDLANKIYISLIKKPNYSSSPLREPPPKFKYGSSDPPKFKYGYCGFTGNSNFSFEKYSNFGIFYAYEKSENQSLDIFSNSYEKSSNQSLFDIFSNSIRTGSNSPNDSIRIGSNSSIYVSTPNTRNR